MMEFGALPPEVNSAWIYTGPGAAPMLAAAAAWRGLAAELGSTAAAYQAVVTRMATELWTGAASTSMASAVTPYVAWLNTTAALAERAATQATSAAAAFETAFAMTVPPPVIVANRSLLMTLVATNFGAGMSAGMGQASSVGMLSVPPAWAANATAGSTATALPGATLTAAAERGLGAMPAGMPVGALGRRATSAAPDQSYGFRPTVTMHPVAAG